MAELADPLIDQASQAAGLLKSLANEQRLLILCHLIAEEEMGAGELADRVGLTQSALSQHLAKLRTQELVAVRSEAQSRFYRIADERAERVVDLMADLYCPQIKEDSR